MPLTPEVLKAFVVEYSITQDATHVRTLRAMLENNRRNLGNGLSMDYVPIGLFGSRADAESFVNEFQMTLAREAQLQAKTYNWRRISEIVDELLLRFLSDLSV